MNGNCSRETVIQGETMNESSFPRIRTTFEEGENHFYAQEIQNIISNLVDPEIFSKENAFDHFQALLPMMSWTSIKEPPFNISFFICCRFRPTAFRFFYEMISKWLFPGRRLNVLLQFAADFILPDLGEEMYIACKVMVRVENARELAQISQNLPIIESEIRLGIESYYHASRILEIKGLASDEKTGMIQENIAMLVKRRPQDFDYDIFSEMQHFLVLCKAEFKTERSFRHISRIISTHYLFRKAMKMSFETFPERRYISVKLVREQITVQGAKKAVLGIAIALSFLHENEILEKKHIVNAISALIPTVSEVEGSFFQNLSRSGPVRTFYIEVEKKKQIPFTLDEGKKIKENLSNVLKQRIEKRLSPIFMPENEEEIMRHILTLSSQLKYVKDMPQTVISFNKQTEDSLEFLVVFVRIVEENSRPLQDSFEGKSHYLEFISNRIKVIGSLRNKYKKEANVFYVRVPKTLFLRQDHSVDLYKARSELVSSLIFLLGDFRDYNGGTISKETELFANLRKSLGKEGKGNALLLEDFFYSLSPSVMRSVLPPEPLKKLFTILLDFNKMKGGNDPLFRLEEDRRFCYLLIRGDDPYIRERVQTALEELKFPSLHLATTFIATSDQSTICVLARHYEKKTLLTLRLAIEKTLSSANHK